jgi:hypothetical protein
MRLLPRVGFALLVSVALASVLGSCTHRGTPAPIPSMTAVPTQRTVFVNAKTGSDTSNGSQTTPYKTITRALRAVASPGPIPVLDIEIASGDYNTANGEKFPLVIPPVMGLVINGSLYGRGVTKGAFVDGAGEDTGYEKLVGAPAGSFFTTIAIQPTAQISVTNLYVGVLRPALPSGLAIYDAFDDVGSLTGTTSSFNSPPTLGTPRLNGVLVAGGTLNCASCTIGGKGYAIAAFSIATSDCSTGTQCPTVTLTGPPASGNGSIGAPIGIRTDGSAFVTASNQTFSSGLVAYSDDYAPLVTTGLTPGLVDFGQGQGSPQSTGNNVFLGARTSEISLTLSGGTIAAFGDTWNPNVQGSNPSGQYRVDTIFSQGASGRNVTIAASATGAKVHVGPFKQPTPSPSTSPTGSPSGSPSPSPSPT